MFADPFDEGLARVVRQCGHSLEGEGVKLHDEGTLVCMGKPFPFCSNSYQTTEQMFPQGKSCRAVENRSPKPTATSHHFLHKLLEPPKLTRCKEGPQFSTRAESRLYRSWGGSVINMSALPEAKLAREAEMSYQMICMATDYDCWRSPPPRSITAGEKSEGNEDVTVAMVMAHMRANADNARRFVGAVLDELSKPEHAALVEGRYLAGQTKLAGGITGKEGRSAKAAGRLEWLLPGYFV